MTSAERLIHMANQIAVNLATDPDPVAATANHIRLYWDPRMKQMISSNLLEGLSDVAKAAIIHL
jgi:formate dehydrogenase subunit delta